jgi:hypothetical protein
MFLYDVHIYTDEMVRPAFEGESRGEERFHRSIPDLVVACEKRIRQDNIVS